MEQKVVLMSSEERAFGRGMFVFMFAFLLSMIMLLMGEVLTSVIILLIGLFGGVMIILLPEFFPESEEKKPRKTSKIPSEPLTMERPPRKIYGIIIGVSVTFLVILLGMVWWKLVEAKEGIIIAVFTVIFQVILYVVAELARKR